MRRTRLIEEASLNAWPALNSLLYDGWLLRFANGYTKRANSVTPLYRGDLKPDTKIAFCAEQYRQQGLQPIFRLAQINDIRDLDLKLEALAYDQIDVTTVQGRTLRQRFVLPVRASVVDLASWLHNYHALNPSRRDVKTHEAILQRIIGNVCPLVLSARGNVLACGLGVLQGHYLGLFDIVTLESERRKGYGREVTESLLAWGQGRGASYAYLQVMLSNKAARSLYEQLGFREQYQYWYRVAAR